MQPLNIRITERIELNGRAHETSVEIGRGEQGLSIRPVLDTRADTLELVPGDAADMAEALAEVSKELGCQNTLDDMLHAIDALKKAARA